MFHRSQSQRQNLLFSAMMQVGNYLAFYIVSEDKKQVSIVRFLYAKSDWNSILIQISFSP